MEKHQKLSEKVSVSDSDSDGKRSCELLYLFRKASANGKKGSEKKSSKGLGYY